MTMDFGLYGIGLTGLARSGVSPAGWPKKSAIQYFRSGFVCLSAVLIASLGAWVLLSGDPGDTAESEPVRLATAATEFPPLPATATAQDDVTAQDDLSLNPATPETISPAAPSPVDGLRISSQSWRRGGLGSKALVTFTLRNANDYAVKDIELFCSFSRRDGSHLTDRRRVIRDSVEMKSRKTFSRVHVGFVNINANKAKCLLVAASHV
jgi:hypothetical protein